MAIATGTAIALGVSAAIGAGQAVAGAAKERKAKRALDKFKRQDLESAAGGMRVSTLGAELQTQEAQRRFSTSVDALQSGGVRGLVGGLGRVEQAQGVQQRQISSDLDRQQVAIGQMKFNEAQTLRNMQESRESFEIGRLSSQQLQGQQQVASGLSQVGSAAMQGVMSMDSMQYKDPTVKTSGGNNLTEKTFDDFVNDSKNQSLRIN